MHVVLASQRMCLKIMDYNDCSTVTNGNSHIKGAASHKIVSDGEKLRLKGFTGQQTNN